MYASEATINLPRLPDDWTWTTLGDVCSPPQYGWTTSARGTGKLKLLRTTDITSGQIDWNQVPFCEIDPPNPEKYLLQPGDVVISRAGSVGFSHLIKSAEPAVFASYLIRFHPVGIDPVYLSYFLKSPAYWEAISEAKLGIAVQNVNATKLKEIQIPLPPLLEQKAIVEIIETQFTRLDAAVAALKRVQANLRRYRAAVLKAACEGWLVPTEAELALAERRTYEPAAALLERILAERRAQWQAEHPGKQYKELAGPDVSTLPELPEGWCWAQVKQVGEVQLGRQRAPQHHQGPFMRPYLRVANVYEDRIDTSDVLEMNFTPSEFETYQLHYGDILLNEGQSPEFLGRPAMYQDEVPGACFQNTLIRFQAASGVLPEYALAVFRHYLHSGRFQRLSQITTNIAHLSAGRFAEIEFPLPPLDEQARIVEELDRRMSLSDQTDKAIDQGNKRGSRLRQSILQRAFSGKLTMGQVIGAPVQLTFDM